MGYLQVEVELADGRKVIEERGKVADVQTALTNYDPGLVLVRDFGDESRRRVPGWEVHRKDPDTAHQGRVARVDGDYLPDPGWWVADIAAHDTRRGYDPYVETVVRAEREREAREAEAVDKLMESSDEIHYQLVDEFSAHAPATRPMPLGNGKA